MAQTRGRSWRDDLLSGLPEPNEDRGNAARGLYEHRDQIGHQVAYAGMMAAWQHDHAVTVHAFLTSDEI